MFVITLAQHYRQSRNKIERCCGRVRASSNISIVWHYFAQSPHPQSLRKKVLCAASREKGTTHNLNSTPTNRHSIRIWPKQRSRHNSCLLYMHILYIHIQGGACYDMTPLCLNFRLEVLGKIKGEPLIVMCSAAEWFVLCFVWCCKHLLWKAFRIKLLAQF